MLKSLQIENIATIEKLSVDFSDGLNVLTGETGAGKPILVICKSKFYACHHIAKGFCLFKPFAILISTYNKNIKLNLSN